MIVVPAVDIRQGRVVRLTQGELRAETVYGSDPAEVAQRFAEAGARRLHVVDLDAAMRGPRQIDAVADLLSAVSIPVEVGGGLRNLDDAATYRRLGVDRVVFGTAAVADPGVVQLAAQLWPEAVAVALDVRNGTVTVEGWQEITTMKPLDLARKAKAWGLRRVQYTDVVRDGTLVGPNLAALADVAYRTGLKVTAAGGVSTLDDLRRLRELEELGVDEVIVGKALYERRFTLEEANGVADGAL
ncbi:MAG TPA: 1-(5-phosphoribosyl)-5-[(5-phosphoribosylamino)methylideneamino]imidazole-4-carboxamide isomerase [Vicinamibacteria bacterium]|jgi:phosphoribosylformimino-5-aminoimidazole carboxamide ribotide isomerase